MTRLSLHAAAEDPQATLLGLHMALPESLPDDTSELRVTVIPPPGEDGLLPTKDGRELRVADPVALATALNDQATDARVDFDHTSEPSSKNYRGSTAAEGWAKDFRAAADGAITAVLSLSAWALHAIRTKRYRYLSPAVYASGDRQIAGLSSVALVNNPNFPIPALNDDTGGTQTAAGLEAREAAVTAREESAEKLLLNAATRVVDVAIAGKRLLPAQKEFALNAIQHHAEGVEQGIAAFESAYPAETSVAPGLNQLDRRVAPTGAPAHAGASAAGITTPPGVMVDNEQLTLHGQVAAHARERGISYRAAVLELGALQ